MVRLVALSGLRFERCVTALERPFLRSEPLTLVARVFDLEFRTMRFSVRPTPARDDCLTFLPDSARTLEFLLATLVRSVWDALLVRRLLRSL